MLSALEWSSPASRYPRSSAQSVAGTSWLLARIWSVGGLLQASPLKPGTTRIILGMEGEARIRIGAEQITVAPRQLVLFDHSQSIETSSESLWVRCEWRLRAPALQQKRISTYFAHPIKVSSGGYSLITAVTNTISTNPELGESASEPMLLDGFASIVMSAVLEGVNEPMGLSPNRAKLFREVVRTIEERYDQRDFTVQALASAVSISSDYLRHLCAATGQSPREMIERRRVAAVMTALSATPARSRDTLESVARSAGFTTVQRMQDAMNRQHRWRL